MKLEDVSSLDLAYLEGFVEKCAEKGVDAEKFLELIEKDAKSIARKDDHGKESLPKAAK